MDPRGACVATRARVGGRARSREERVESPGPRGKRRRVPIASSRALVRLREVFVPASSQSLRDGIEHIGGRGAAEERAAEETFGHDASRGPDVGGAGSLARRRGPADGELLGRGTIACRST